MGEVSQEMTMANSSSELIGSDLTWRHDGAAWVLLHKRRRSCAVRTLRRGEAFDYQKGL
jgi:hypothetical protein